MDLPCREEEELVWASLLSGVVEVVEVVEVVLVLALDGADLDCLVGLD